MAPTNALQLDASNLDQLRSRLRVRGVDDPGDVKMAAIEENTPGATPVHVCEIAPERHER